MEECPVCYEECKMDALRCGHKLCDSCKHEWFRTSPTCPTCRTPVVDPQFVWNDCCPPAPLTREQELEVRFITLVADLFQYTVDTNNAPQTPRDFGA